VAEMFDCQILIWTSFPEPQKERESKNLFLDREFKFMDDPTVHFYPSTSIKTEKGDAAPLPILRLFYSKNRQYDSLWLMRKGLRLSVTLRNSGGLSGDQLEENVLKERQKAEGKEPKKSKFRAAALESRGHFTGIAQYIGPVVFRDVTEFKHLLELTEILTDFDTEGWNLNSKETKTYVNQRDPSIIVKYPFYEISRGELERFGFLPTPIQDDADSDESDEENEQISNPFIISENKRKEGIPSELLIMNICGRQELVDKAVAYVRKSAAESSLVQCWIGGKYDELTEVEFVKDNVTQNVKKAGNFIVKTTKLKGSGGGGSQEKKTK